MFAAPDNTPKTEESLPFDLRTVLIGIWNKRLIFLLLLPLAIILGIVAGSHLGRQVFESRALVLYRPQNPADQNDPAARLQTRRDIVKVNDNLEEVRNRLDLDISLDQLGSAYEVVVAKNSTLMVVSAKWNNPEMAARLVNTLIDVFIEEQQQLSNTELASRLGDARRNLSVIVRHASKADAALTIYVKKHDIIDITKDGNSYMDQYSHLDTQQQEAQNRLTSINLQIASINAMLAQYRSRARDSQQNIKQLDDISAISLRMDRIRQAIADDKASQANAATLAQLESEKSLAQKMFDVGAISHQELDKAITAYKKQEAITNDSAQTKEWKKELAKLQLLAVPNSASPMVQELMAKLIDFQLEAIHMQSTVRNSQIEMERVKQQIATFPTIVREYTKLEHEAALAKAMKTQAIEKTADLQAQFNARTPDYSIVARAKANRKPVSSTRKPLTAACTVIAILLATLPILAVIIFDPTIKSSAEGRLKLRLPVWRELPRFTKGYLPDTQLFADPQRGILARYLSQMIHHHPERYLITSPKHQAGVTTITLNLAAAYAHSGKRVVVVSAHALFAMPTTGMTASSAVLQRFIEGATQEITTGIQPHDALGIDYLFCDNPEQYPTLIAMPRMQQLLDNLAGQYDIVLVDAPPVLPYGDTEQLVQWVDAVILVVASQSDTVTAIRNASSRIQIMRPAHFGVVLNRVDTSFLDV